MGGLRKRCGYGQDTGCGESEFVLFIDFASLHLASALVYLPWAGDLVSDSRAIIE